MVEMSIVGLAIDPSNRVPITLIRDINGKRQVPILIDHEQANNIIIGIEQSNSEKISSHDLMISLIKAGNLSIEKIIIHSIKNETFEAVLKLVYTNSSTLENESIERNVIEIEARPSDAIALAVRSNCGIWMLEEVVSKASIAVDAEADKADQQEFRNFLDNINPESLIQHLNSRKNSNHDSNQ